MRNKYKLKNRDSSIALTVALSLIINVLIYLVVVFLILFTTKFDWNALFPRWVLGGVEVPAGTPGAFYDLGVFIISGIVQTLGLFLYFNTFWSQWLKKSLEVAYRFISRVILKFSYLMSSKEFREEIKRLDRENKIETWKIKQSVELQNLNTKLTHKMSYELSRPAEEQSEETKKFSEKENDIMMKLNDEWIDKNIDYQKLRYPRLNTQMVLYGKTKIVVNRIGVEDTAKVIRNEIIFKVLFGILSMAVIAVFIALKAPGLKEDIWNTLKDFVIYSIALILNIILGFRSAEIAHTSRVRQAEDRLTIIRNYIGDDKINDAKSTVIEETKKVTTESLEAELERCKRIEKRSG